MKVKIIQCSDIDTGKEKFTHTKGSVRFLTLGQTAILAHVDEKNGARYTTLVESVSIQGNRINICTQNTKYKLKVL